VISARFREVYRLEIAHHLRRPLFWILLLLIGFMSWELSTGHATIGSGSSSVGGGKAWITSEFAQSQLLAMMLTVLYSLFIAVAAGMTVIRDHELKVGELLHATPLSPAEYVWAKFAAVLTTFTTILMLQIGMMIFFNHGVPHGENVDVIGPFAPLAYLKPALFFALPQLIFIAGTSFALGALTRMPIVVFAIPIAVLVGGAFFLWDWSPVWLAPSINALLMIVDVSAVRWLQETWLLVDKGIDFYNHAPVGFDAVFWANRAIAVGAGLGAVAFTGARFAAHLRGVAGGRPRRQAAVSATDVAPRGHAPLSALAMRAAPVGFLAGTIEIARVELRELRRQPGLYLFGPLILIQTLGGVVSVGAFDTPLLQTPGTQAMASMNTLSLLLCLLVLFYMVESLQRERGNGIGPISYSTPLRTGALLLGKALANTLVGAVILALNLIGSAIVIAIQGKVAFDVAPFALVWGLLLLPTLLFWSTFVGAVYSITSSRIGTYAIGLGVMGLTGFLQVRDHMNWVANWPLWSASRWTDIATFELDRTPLILNRVLVLGMAALFVALTVRLFPRREADAVQRLHRLRPGALARGALGLLPFAFVPLVAGTWLGVLVSRGYEGGLQKKLEHDYWRQNVATWSDAPGVALRDVDMDVEFEPTRRFFRVKGWYDLSNPNAAPLARFALTGGTHWKKVAWTLNGAPYKPEDRSRLYVFTPVGPLGPGAKTRVGFSYEGVYRDGISKNGAGSMEFILPSAVVLTGFSGPSFAPQLGYLKDVGIEEKKNRADGRVYPAGFHQGYTPTDLPMADQWFTTRMRITGPAHFRFNATGVLVDEKVANGRRTTVWKSDRPVRIFNVVGGRWKVKEGGGAAVYYDPRHAYNVEEMHEALVGARRWYSKWFAPYPWRDLRLSEFPALATYAQAPATNITFSESIGFLTRSQPQSKAAFWVASHEAAHQWWGNLVTPGRGPGGEVISESMAHFSTILLTERVKGLEQRIAFCRQIEDHYANQRRADDEQPLTRLDMSRDTDKTVLYDRGGFVLWMLFQHLGPERAFEGLRSFVAAWRDGPDHPVLEDYLDHMRRYAPDPIAYDAFVDQWFRRVTVPELRLNDSRVARAGDVWEARASIRNAGSGAVPVEVAATRGVRFPKPGEKAEPYRESRVTVSLDPQHPRELVIRCPFQPEALVVDPDVTLLQLERSKARTTLSRPKRGPTEATAERRASPAPLPG
jgi:ABC-2 type transport system permease protein